MSRGDALVHLRATGGDHVVVGHPDKVVEDRGNRPRRSLTLERDRPLSSGRGAAVFHAAERDLPPRQNVYLKPSLTMRGATISWTRPKYEVVALAASNAAWEANACVRVPRLPWAAFVFVTLCSSRNAATRAWRCSSNALSTFSESRFRKSARYVPRGSARTVVEPCARVACDGRSKGSPLRP